MPLALALFALSACGATGGSSAPAVGYAPALPSLKPQRDAVMGADARMLSRMFGEPRLDIRDPTARKLQFGNAVCVLDTYLYPPKPRREPVVTFAEARTPEGAEMSWADCAKKLVQR